MTATHGPVGDIRFDETGEIRCYWCGARSFTEKRTGRAKVAGAVAAVTVVGAVVGAAGAGDEKEDALPSVRHVQ